MKVQCALFNELFCSKEIPDRSVKQNIIIPPLSF